MSIKEVINMTIMRDGQYVDTFNMKDITESDLIHAMVGKIGRASCRERV